MTTKAFRKGKIIFRADDKGRQIKDSAEHFHSINAAKRFSRTVLGLMQVRKIKEN